MSLILWINLAIYNMISPHVKLLSNPIFQKFWYYRNSQIHYEKLLVIQITSLGFKLFFIN
jgi:hypothetical protein